MRTSRPARHARAPNQLRGLVFHRPGAPAGCSRCERLPDTPASCAASSKAARPTCASPPPWPPLSASDGSDADTLCETPDPDELRSAPLPSASPPAFANFCSPVSPVSVSSHAICCQTGMKITSYSHHATAPSSPGALVLKPRLPGRSSLRSSPINFSRFSRRGPFQLPLSSALNRTRPQRVPEKTKPLEVVDQTK